MYTKGRFGRLDSSLLFQATVAKELEPDGPKIVDSPHPVYIQRRWEKRHWWSIMNSTWVGGARAPGALPNDFLAWSFLLPQSRKEYNFNVLFSSQNKSTIIKFSYLCIVWNSEPSLWFQKVGRQNKYNNTNQSIRWMWVSKFSQIATNCIVLVCTKINSAIANSFFS